MLASAAAIGPPDITSFANGIIRDIDAVCNAIFIAIPVIGMAFFEFTT